MLIVLSERRRSVDNFPFSHNPLIRSRYGMKNLETIAIFPAEIEARASLISSDG
jgi:hypothetical protein